MLDRGLGGVGFWALGYDAGDPVLWTVVDNAVAAADADGGESGSGTGGAGSGGSGWGSDTGSVEGSGSDDETAGVGAGEGSGKGRGCAVAPVSGGVLLSLAALVGRRRRRDAVESSSGMRFG